MKLFRVKRPQFDVGYDEFDSFVVSAETAEQAVTFHPQGEHVWRMMTPEEAKQYWDEPREAWLPIWSDGWLSYDGTWGAPSSLTAEHVGDALPETPAGTVILASFNAG